MTYRMPAFEIKDEIKPLTAFRFIAAVGVFLDHLDFFSGSPELRSIYENYFGKGYIGVIFFFILSGFILTYNYHSKLVSLASTETKKFFVSRFARIYPVHVLTFVLALPLVYHSIPTDLAGEAANVLINLLLLQGFLPVFFRDYNIPSWSLSDELFFYILLPLILVSCSWIKRLAVIKVGGLAVSLWVVAVGVVWFLKDIAFSHWLFYISPYFQLVNFLMGALLCFVFLGIRNARLSRSAMTLFEVASIVGLFVAIQHASNSRTPFLESVYYTPVFSFIIIVFAFQRGWLSQFMSKPLLVHLGEISFSFYMLHRIVISYLGQFGILILNPLNGAIVAFVVTVGLSLVCYRFFEIPLRKVLRQGFDFNLVARTNSDIESRTSLHHESRSNERDPFRYQLILGAVIISIVIGVTLFPSLQLGLANAEWNFFEAAQKLNLSQYLQHSFDPSVQLYNYRPLIRMSFWGQYLAFGTDFVGYRFERVVVHVMDVVLLAATIFMITRRRAIAFVSAILFAVLPFYSRFILDLTDPIPEAILFCLVCVASWVIFLRTGSGKYSRISAAAFVLALLAKEASVTVFVILLFVDRWVTRDRIGGWESVRRYALFVIVLIGYLIVELSVVPLSGDSYIVFVWIPLSIIVFALFLSEQIDAGIAYAGLGGVAVILLWISGNSETIRSNSYETAGILATLIIALLASRPRLPVFAKIVAALAVACAVPLSSLAIWNAAADLQEGIRRSRVPFRDISLVHSSFPNDTYLYFINPPAFRDLSGLFLSRFGSRVSVGSSADNNWINLLNTSFGRIGASNLVNYSGESQRAGLDMHENSLVYYFDPTGKPVPAAVRTGIATTSSPNLPIDFEESIRLEGYEIASSSLRRGDALVLLLYWSASQKIEKDYTVFVHLTTKDGMMLDGYDSQPRQGAAPTSNWATGRMVVDPIVFPISFDLSPGAEYRLEIGLYNPVDLTRLSLVNSEGKPIGDHVAIGPLSITE